METQINIAIFVSGSGTNMENIMLHFEKNKKIKVAAVYCNNPEAYALKRAEKYKIPRIVFTKPQFFETHEVLHDLQSRHIDWIILAGFLWLVPQSILQAFPQRIINIHPALLPDFGGKGMYGMRVHEAVIKQGKRESGITIHTVDEKYDNGNILFQAKCKVSEMDTPQDLAHKIHQLEQQYFPIIIEKTVLENHTNLRKTSI